MVETIEVCPFCHATIQADVMDATATLAHHMASVHGVEPTPVSAEEHARAMELLQRSRRASRLPRDWHDKLAEGRAAMYGDAYRKLHSHPPTKAREGKARKREKVDEALGLLVNLYARSVQDVEKISEKVTEYLSSPGGLDEFVERLGFDPKLKTVGPKRVKRLLRKLGV
jgi:hypothetical protein